MRVSEHRKEQRRNRPTGGGRYIITRPPSTASTWPVMYAASSDARNATAFAISSVVPNRPWVVNTGSGKATVYQEGKAYAATWKKDSFTGLTRFYDSNGAEIPFVRGEIFMQSVSPDTKVTVS